MGYLNQNRMKTAMQELRSDLVAAIDTDKELTPGNYYKETYEQD